MKDGWKVIGKTVFCSDINSNEIRSQNIHGAMDDGVLVGAELAHNRPPSIL
jgi:hypothetical protein